MPASTQVTPSEYRRVAREKDSEGLEVLGGVNGILQGLDSDANKGLSFATIQKRKSESTTSDSDENDKQLAKILPGFCFVGTAIDGSLWPLVVTGCVAFAIWGNHFIKKIKLRHLSKLSKELSTVTAIRDNKNVRISGSELVIGDVIILEKGDYAPCDGLVLDSNDPFATPEAGNKFLCLDTHAPAAKVNYRMSELSNIAGLLGLVSAVSIFLVLVALAVVVTTYHNLDSYSLIDYIIVAILIISTTLPEVLPLAIVLLFNYSNSNDIKRMKEKRLPFVCSAE
eukprot:TRINITY_DN15737_c0_g1_i1.p1 TRINITY_DN15737_c0_g1~~TRINITY_DN15737_c0_g1_i1.p1  ORF type:complete len:283 (+),score=28.52 TRINITY_DN15737_c0_g1_i1:69-917(+)